ncbi:MAG: hypothetical protein AAF206_16270 [Bacteroidota bacterium]
MNYWLLSISTLKKRVFLAFSVCIVLPGLKPDLGLSFSVMLGKKRQYVVRMIDKRTELDTIHRLTYHTFRKRGICPENESGLLRNNLHLDELDNTIVLAAMWGKEIMGTVSFTHTRSIQELYNYDLFEEDLSDVDLEGKVAFSAWRLAIADHPPHHRLMMLHLQLALMELAFYHHAETGFFSFVSEHLSFYKRMFADGQVVGTREKKANSINGEMTMMRFPVSTDQYLLQRSWKNRLEERIYKREQAARELVHA